ncbi:hypothetical protein BC828DRAFT_406611 [Blastocladiella britannica]|nr:hypothetical protein BC828DRAFT_406611 [Blastocladiella britannica]
MASAPRTHFGTLTTATGTTTTLPLLHWQQGQIITPLTRDLTRFLYATRKITYNAEQIPKAFELQDAGDRLIFALWIPEHTFTKYLESYETTSGHGRGKIMSWDEDDAFIPFDLREECTPMDIGGEPWRPVGVVAAEYVNYDYTVDKFGGDEDKWSRFYASRATRTASICMLAVPFPFEKRGFGSSLLDFVEEWVIRHGLTVEDARRVMFDDESEYGRALIKEGGPAVIEARLGGETTRSLPCYPNIALCTIHYRAVMYEKRGYKETIRVKEHWGMCVFLHKVFD